MTRPTADAVMTRYDEAVARYRLLVRIGAESPEIEKAFETWNALREEIIDVLCGEKERGAA